MRFRIARFGLVGGCATITLAIIYSALVVDRTLTPFWANIFGYIIAFAVSFLGHRFWTFGDAERGGRNNYAIFRFLIVSLSGLTLNSSAVLILHDWLRLPAWAPLIVFVFFTPLFAFFLNRFWVFYALK
jgi:putative flippase GtrA